MSNLNVSIVFTAVNKIGSAAKSVMASVTGLTTATEQASAATGALETATQSVGSALDKSAQAAGGAAQQVGAVSIAETEATGASNALEAATKGMGTAIDKSAEAAGGAARQVGAVSIAETKATGTSNALEVATKRVGRAMDETGQAAGGAAQQINTAADRMAQARDEMDRTLARGMQGAFVGAALSKTGKSILAPLTAGVKNAAMFEDLETSFVVLLGGADAAKDRVAELAKFAASTNFEIAGVSQASIVLETFTKGALSVGDGLRLVGDVAAAAGRPIEDVALHFGRLYDGIQSGAPIGQALLRIQEMGMLSGDARREITEALEAGEDPDEVWALVTTQFEQFRGMMDERSKTLSGQWGNLTESVMLASAALGQTLMPVLKPIISTLATVVEWVGNLAKRFPKLTAAITIPVAVVGALILAGGTLLTTIVAVFFDTPATLTYFFDPPYVEADPGAAYDAFTPKQMARVRTCCDQLQGPWLLSCDDSPTCREIFADHHWLQLPIKYPTDNQPGKKTPTSHELLILSPTPHPPTKSRLSRHPEMNHSHFKCARFSNQVRAYRASLHTPHERMLFESGLTRWD